MPRVLLIQIRDPGSMMEAHEQRCMAEHLAGGYRELVVHNALAEPARVSWLDGVDAVIIGGSGAYSVHHPDSGHFVDPLRPIVDRILDEGLPGFGICFGHQLLGLHLGARVETDYSRRESGTIEVELTEAGHADPVFGTFAPRLHVHTGHTDHVMELPPGVTSLARTDAVEHQAFKVDGKPFWTTQFHPDLSARQARDRYAAYIAGLGNGGSPEPPEPFTEVGDVANRLLAHFLDEVR